FQLADAELELRPVTNQNALELRSARVFLDPPIVRAAVAASRQSAAISNSSAQQDRRSSETPLRPMLVSTYFVNELRVGTNATPYSMVTAIGAPIVPAEMRD